ncbi:MAG: DUF2085 domain-containing protein [Candidatus Zixiibacteriota bacterium]|jgi:uncharacterized membrane protein
MPGLDHVLHFFGYAVCHCLPNRTLTLGGEYLPVCARCTGIYVGIAVTYVFLISRRGFRVNALPKLPVAMAIVALLLPMAVDGVSSYLGLRETTNTLRFLTGLSAGSALPIFAFPLLSAELIVDKNDKEIVRPFGRVWDYPIWLGSVAAAGALVMSGWSWLYYPISILTVLGLAGIFFNLSLTVWEMALERAGKWGKRPRTFIPAALTVLLIFTLLNVFHYYTFRAMMNATGGELPQ